MAHEIVFTEATREQLKLRLALTGVTGGGKTYTALALMTYLLGGELRDPKMARRIAVLDTERGSASRYAKGRPFHFFHNRPTSFEPEMFVAAIRAAERAGFEGLIIDSLSHEWIGTGGALEQVDRAAKNGNTFVAWGSVTPRHNAVIDAIMGSSMHIIATMRAKMAHEQTTDKNGKKVVNKLGLAAMQRDGIEYEFDIIGDMAIDNELTITKSRCEDLTGKFFKLPGRELADIMSAWLADGEVTPPPVPPVHPVAFTAADIVEQIKVAETVSKVEALIAKSKPWPKVRAIGWKRVLDLTSSAFLDIVREKYRVDITDAVILATLDAHRAPAPVVAAEPGSEG
jgi:hypothetical protein